jgi:D-psicose/D-tagatose/L-ribulose 3-epimerase
LKLGISAFAWTTEFTPAHLHLLDFARSIGFDCFEIPLFDPSKLAAKELRRGFEASGIECTVCAILPVGINPISKDAATRQHSIDHLKRSIETAAAIGAHRIGGPLYAPIGYLPPHRPTADEWKWAIEAFQQITSTLDAHQMTLAIEPVNRSESFFLRTVADSIKLCEVINHPRIGILVDTFHANIEEKNVTEALKTAGSWLRHLHLSENDRSLIGSGHIDFPGVLKTLREIHYDGYLMIEGFGYSEAKDNVLGALWADPKVSSEQIALDGINFLKSLLSVHPSHIYS